MRVLTERVDRRKTVASRQRCDLRAMDVREGIRRNDKAAIQFPGLCSNDGFELGRVANGGRDRLHSERQSGGFEWVQEIFGIWRRYRVEQERDPGNAQRNLLEQLQPLAGHRRLNTGEAGYVTTWQRKARDEAAPDRIGNGRENDGNGARLLQQRGCRGCNVRKNGVGL